MYYFRLLVLLLSICGASVLTSQDSSDSPKVGLALSGGAAHGFAHIGVLKYFEEIGLEIDYITGTSMGSVIGGLYAMGFSADEIAEISEGLDWKLLMSNRSPLWEVAPVEKETHEKIPLSIVWKDNAFRFPKGLMQGQKLDLIISKIYSPAYFIDDFDDFYIPFRCLAVDIEDGSIDILDSGYIGEAIRASMAIPSVFPPKDIDGTLYVDGGLLRNYPVQEVIDMGADITIGVYVGGEKNSRDELYSAIDVFKQSTWMASILDSEEQEELLDISIRPDIDEIGSFEFDRHEDFIELGYQKARENADALKAIAKQQTPKIKHNPKLNKVDYMRFSEISTSNIDPVFNRMIVNKLNFKTSENATFSQLEESLSLVYGTKSFSKTNYNFDIIDNGIELIVDTEDVDPFSLGLSLNRFRFYNAAIILKAGIHNKIGKPSSLQTTIRLSENPGIEGQYYYRLPANPSYLLKIAGQFETHRLPFFNGKNIDRLYTNNDLWVEFGVDKEWKNKYLFKFHYRYQFDRIRPVTFRENDVRFYKTFKHGIRAGLNYNSTNRNVFPTSGRKISVLANYIFSNRLRRENQTIGADFISIPEDRAYINLDLDYREFKSFRQICAEFYVKGRLSTGQSLLDSYYIGGPIQEKDRVYGFIGLNDSELIMGDHISGKMALRYNFREKLYIIPQIQYIYGSNYLSYAFSEERTISVFGYGLGFGINSPIGPIYIDIGLTDTKDRLVSNLGFGFRHLM
ncbi:patatin-like phospholipase family protein [Saprospiraceae bacterium]|nr:patatin-like phospholipase family protein [Saprospiraceae bacterium]